MPRPAPRGWLLLCHYWFPVAAGWSVAMVMQRCCGAAFSPAGLMLLLAGIGCAYSIDRLLDAPRGAASPRWLRGVLAGGALLYGLVALVALWWLPLVIAEIAVVLALATLAYPQLKRFPLLKNVLVAFVWVAAAALFPFGGEGQGGGGVQGAAVGAESVASSPSILWQWLRWDVTAPLLLLWVAACLLCDVKDEEEDRANAVPSVPNLVGTLWACRIAAGLSLVAGGMAYRNERWGMVVASVLLVVLAQLPALLKRKALGPLVVDAVLVVPGLLLAFNWA